MRLHISKTGSGSTPWVVRKENGGVLHRARTKRTAKNWARRNKTGASVIVHYANKRGIDNEFTVTGG